MDNDGKERESKRTHGREGMEWKIRGEERRKRSECT